MKFTSEINSRAKEIREEAAKRFGGVASDYNWQEAVKLACEGFEFEAKKETFEKPENELIQRRIPLAMALDKTRNPNNASVNNIFRNLNAEKALKEFDTAHPEVIGWLIQMFGEEDIVVAA